MPCALIVMVNASLSERLLATGSMTVFCFLLKKFLKMANNPNPNATSVQNSLAPAQNEHKIQVGEILKENADCAFEMFDHNPKNDDLFFDWLECLRRLRSFEHQVKERRAAV